MHRIKSIAINNIQSHKDTELVFSEGINVITGQSDSGKSAILKSFEWLRTNRPLGETLRNWDIKEDPMSVEVSLDDGTVAITREDGKTSYLVCTEEEEKTFSAIKSDVPEEISDLLNLAEYNVQGQHDKYFLLQDSPGEVAKKLNDLVGLSIIDKAYKNINSKIRTLNTNISNLKTSRNELEESLDKYENLDEIKKLIDSIEKRQSLIRSSATTLNDLQKLASSHELIEKDKAELLPLLSIEDKVCSLLKQTESAISLTETLKDLKHFGKNMETITEEIASERLWLEMEPISSEILSGIKTVLTKEETVKDLKSFSRLLDDINRTKEKTQKDLSDYIENYIEILGKSKECPTCGTVLDKGKLNKLQKILPDLL